MKAYLNLAIPAFVFLSGCSSINIGNVSFSQEQICSREYSPNIFQKTFSEIGECLPPARATSIQNFYFHNSRLPINITEADNIIKASKEKTNPLPSIIGQSFILINKSGKNKDWEPPSSGNFYFLPVAESTSSIQATPFIRTSIAGIVKERGSLGVTAPINEIMNAAMGEKYMALLRAPKNKTLFDSLQKIIVRFAIAQSQEDISRGTYTYISINPDELSKIIGAFESCGWLQHKETDHTTQGIFSSLGSTGDIGTNKPSQKKQVRECPNFVSADNKYIGSTAANIIKEISDIARTSSRIEHIGFITGAAIIHTKQAQSARCSGLITQATVDDEQGEKKSGSSCDSLKSELASNKSDLFSLGIEIDPSVLAFQISAAYERSTYTTLNIENHASVLAIQWIPLDVQQDIK